MTTTLQEFDNLDPGSLDVIFEYKADDVMMQKEDIRNDIRSKREIGGEKRVQVAKKVRPKRQV